MLLLNSNGIINRLICKNCNYKFFEKNRDKLFCSKECRLSYELKYGPYLKIKLVYNKFKKKIN